MTTAAPSDSSLSQPYYKECYYNFLDEASKFADVDLLVRKPEEQWVASYGHANVLISPPPLRMPTCFKEGGIFAGVNAEASCTHSLEYIQLLP